MAKAGSAKKEPGRQAAIRRHNLKKRYGISTDQYAAMLAAQGGVCWICAYAPTEAAKRLGVDHCHKTGTIRGLLCRWCNIALGKFKDDHRLMRRAISYLTRKSPWAKLRRQT
jgi:Recombination endonuclease VII